MYKIAHLSDIHAGYWAYPKKMNEQGINQREADGYIALKKMVSHVIDHEVDSVIVSGDVFHTPYPTIRSIQFVQRQFWRFAQAGIKVYILSGNHDVSDLALDISASRVLDDQSKGIFSHAEPYIHHEIAPGINLHMVSHHMYDAQKHTMGQVKPIDGEINIFATHGSVIDPILEYKLHTKHSPREIVIPDEMLDDKWDYMMLGHIHERGWVGSKDKKTDTLGKKIYYNGSLIRRGFSDAEVPLGRGWTLWEIDNNGTFTSTPKKISQRPQYDFPIIDAKDLSANDITDLIVNNLKTTQIDGQTEYNGKTAPIVRQKVVNLSPGKSAAIGQKYIDENTFHTLYWDLDRSGIKAETSVDKNGKTVSSTDLGSVDLLKAYDDWVKNSFAAENISDAMKEKVIADAKNYVKIGKEFMLDEDDQ